MKNMFFGTKRNVLPEILPNKYQFVKSRPCSNPSHMCRVQQSSYSLRRLKFHGKTRDWSLDWSWNITTTTTRTVRFVLEFRKVYVNLGTPLQPCTKLGIRFPPKKLRLNKSSEFAIRRYQIPIRGSKTRLSVASILKSSGRLSKSCTSGQVCLTNSAKKEQDKRICVGVRCLDGI